MLLRTINAVHDFALLVVACYSHLEDVANPVLGQAHSIKTMVS